MASTLVADIGGTNIRFAIIDKGKLGSFRLYPHEHALTAEHAIKQYLLETRLKPNSLIVGAAGVLLPNGKIQLTNRRFMIDMPKLCRKFGFQTGLLTNDMVLHALGVADLPDTNNACVVYVGTGMGCAYIKGGIVYPSEDGHLTIPKVDSAAQAVGATVWEDMISGPAFLKIYRSLSGPQKPVVQSREVSYLAHHGRDENAIETYRIIARYLSRFCQQIATQKKVSVFYLGGKIMEVLRTTDAQDIFFNNLGKLADIVSFRQIRPEMHSAMTGLKLLEKDLRKTGTTNRVSSSDFYIYHAKKTKNNIVD